MSDSTGTDARTERNRGGNRLREREGERITDEKESILKRKKKSTFLLMSHKVERSARAWTEPGYSRSLEAQAAGGYDYISACGLFYIRFCIIYCNLDVEM